MKIVLWGASSQHFDITDEAKHKLKKLIINFFSSTTSDNERYSIIINADDGFGIIATEACIEFFEQFKIKDYLITFLSSDKEYYSSLSEEIKRYYFEKIEFLKSKGDDEQGKPKYVRDFTNVWLWGKLRNYDAQTAFVNFYSSYIDNANYLITYLDKKSLHERSLKKIIDRHWFDSDKKRIVDLYSAANTLYEKTNYTGVRKQKNSSQYYYRIKMKLPDGTSIDTERGSFANAQLASEARRKHLITLTTQDCDDADRTFDDVFYEFVSVHCKDKPALEKKYITYYNSRIKDKLGSLKVGETEYELERLRVFLTEYEVGDKRTQETCRRLSKEYVSGMRAMLNNFYDYAYNKRYIKSHPMYALPAKWGKDNGAGKKEKNAFVQPLFAYSGNKHKLLPYIHKLFPKKIDTFVDLFGGSAVVSINTLAKQIIINDSDLFLMGIFRGIQRIAPDDAWDLIEGVVEKYSLTKDNEQGYYTCRDEYNQIPYEERCSSYWYWGLVIVWSSFNRSTVQFNQQMEYNAPFGYAKVNFDLARRKFFDFADKVYANNKITFVCDDYSSLGIPENAFVYLDPPYLITTASYNKGWNEDEEERLYDYLEKLDDAGIQWAMSNVLQNNGKEHMMLSELIKQKKYHVHYLDNEYKHANFRRKNKGKTVEVLITNY